MIDEKEFKMIRTLVKNLRKKVYKTTGKVIRIEVTHMNKNNLVNIDDYSIIRILNIVNRHIPEGLSNIGIKSINHKSRSKPLPDLRKIFCKVAKDIGFTYSEIGRVAFMSKDHTDAMAAKSKAEDYLTMGLETRFITLFHIISKEVENDYRDIFNLSEGEIKPKPIVFDDMLQE